jgi:hypothetical protein
MMRRMGLGRFLVRAAVRSAVHSAMYERRVEYSAHYGHPQQPPPYGAPPNHGGHPHYGAQQAPGYGAPYGAPPAHPYGAMPRPAPQSSGCGTAFLAITAVGGLLLGTLFLLVGISMVVSPSNRNEAQSGPGVIAIAFPMFLIPGGAALAGLLWIRAKRRRISRVAALAQTNARLPMQAIATELACSPATAKKILFEAIEAGLVRGRMDIQQDTFFGESVAQPQVYTYAAPCRSCGAPLSLTITPGIPAHCPFCRVAVA